MKSIAHGIRSGLSLDEATAAFKEQNRPKPKKAAPKKAAPKKKAAAPKSAATSKDKSES